MKRIIIVMLSVLVLAGCNAVRYKASTGEVAFSRGKGKVVRRVKVRDRAWTYLWTFIPATVDVSKKLKLKDNERVARLTIWQRNTVGNFIAGIIIGIVAFPNAYTLYADLMESGE